MNMPFTKPEPAWIISAALAAVLLIAAILLPLWRMELVAPQYPEGLVMYAYGDRFEGDSGSYYDDVREINGLNHYIGMKPIEPVTEMKLFMPGLMAAAAAALIVSFIGWKRSWFSALAVAGFWFIPIFFVADLQYWLYNYGHTMDSDAPLNSGDFTPIVFGKTDVWNFHSQNSFEPGFYAMVAAALVITFLPQAIRFAQKRWQERESLHRDQQPISTGIRGRTA
ncbi:MAG TPA: cytochrome C [Dehalococcoidia bacterium]|nr:cytochrome C [Dehalococcoidia bacterium]